MAGVFTATGQGQSGKDMTTAGDSRTTARALLFGLNYPGVPGCALSGCVNDVKNMAEFLAAAKPGIQVRVVDDTAAPEACTRAGILRELGALVAAVNADPACNYVWIHYSGHGSYVRDTSGDEADGRDECLVPLDFRTAGVITDDALVGVLAGFTRKATKVVFVSDSCHSGTVCDLKYRWTSATTATLDNARARAVTARVVLLSGCLDTQTSADAFGVLETTVSGRPEAGGALTGALLNVLRKERLTDAFAVWRSVTAQLRTAGFQQRPLLTSSFNLAKDLSLFA
jgi:metacaspase-1